jgi:hypothetical protein
MKKKLTLLVVGIVLLLSIKMLLSSSLFREWIWRSTAVKPSDTLLVSNLSITPPKGWIITGENTLDYDHSRLLVHFAQIEDVRKMLAAQKEHNEKTQKVTHEVEKYVVGCKTATGVSAQHDANKGKVESIYIAVEPDVLVSVNIIVDADLQQRKEKLATFLADNVKCVAPSATPK